jgi:uncharacterized protein (TIGR02466 family)
MKIEKLFPTPLGIFNLNRKLTADEFSYIQNTQLKQNVGNKSSIDNYILENPNLAELKTFFLSCINEFIKEIYDPINEIVPYITQSWINFTYPTEYHHFHKHQNSFLSGVFYVKVNRHDKIHFVKESSQILFTIPKEFNVFNAESWFFEVEENSLVIFPSYQQHGVLALPYESNERISIAFNTFLKGDIGSEQGLCMVKL